MTVNNSLKVHLLVNIVNGQFQPLIVKYKPKDNCFYSMSIERKI